MDSQSLLIFDWCKMKAEDGTKMACLIFYVEGNVSNFGRPVFILQARVIYKR